MWLGDLIGISQIVDSVIALFRVDFTGRGELADRQVSSLNAFTSNIKAFFPANFCFTRINPRSLSWQQKLAQMLSRLIKIAEEFNVAVYMTNQGKFSQHVS